jgi:hypothetical protein
MKRFLLILFLILFVSGTGNAQIFHKSGRGNVEKGLFGKTSRGGKEVKVKEPRKVLKAKKKQEANEKKLKKEYADSVEKSRKRSYDIQTPEVQARMKQNQANTELRNKEKKKRIKEGSKKAGKKYN